MGAGEVLIVLAAGELMADAENTGGAEKFALCVGTALCGME